MGIARVLYAIALERAEVVGVAELGAERLADRPVSLLPLRPDLARQVALQVGGDAVVVDERVVDVEQEDDRAACSHHRVACRSQSRNPPTKAFRLSTHRAPSGRCFNRLALPPPSTTSSASRARFRSSVTSATCRRHRFFPKRSSPRTPT